MDRNKLNEICQLPQVVIINEAFGKNAHLHLVGGCVRDLILDKQCKDIDLATRLTPDEMTARLEQCGIKWIVTGLRRGTVTAVIEGENVEITTFRNPANEKEFTQSIQDDLPARDFTINAMAIDANVAELIDPFNGRDDLIKGVVRAVGDAHRRFTEDPHRILRMVRFGVAQGRKIEKETLDVAYELTPLLKQVSIERIREEFIKIMLSPHCTHALELLADMKALDIFVPEFRYCIGMVQNKYHQHDVFTHTLRVIENTPPDIETRFAALFHDIAKPRCLTVDDDGSRHFYQHEDRGAELTEEIMLRMKFPLDLTATVKKLVAEHMRPLDCGAKGVRKLMVAMGQELPRWLQLKLADKCGGHNHDEDFMVEWQRFLQMVKKEQERKVTKPFETLAIRGQDLLDLGMKQSPRIGLILKALAEAVIDDPDVNTKEHLLTLAEKYNTQFSK